MNLLQIITENHKRTGGASGITLVQLSVAAGVGISSVRPLIEELEKEKKIIVREGINSNLIFPA